MYKRNKAGIIDINEDKYFIFIQPWPRKTADCIPFKTNEEEGEFSLKCTAFDLVWGCVFTFNLHLIFVYFLY